MGLAGNDELHRALRIDLQAKRPLRIVQHQVGLIASMFAITIDNELVKMDV
jgi:hypothetical protein